METSERLALHTGQTRADAPVARPYLYVSIPKVKSVRFATEAGTVSTLEGEVRCAAGDAIMTGTRGEHWPIQPGVFKQKYRPYGDTVSGQAGDYINVSGVVRARRLAADTTLTLGDGRGTLRGHSGDWVIEYPEADRAIVADDIFQETYHLIGVPVTIGVSAAVSGAVKAMEPVVDALRAMLQHTTFDIRIVESRAANANEVRHSLWCLVQEEPEPLDGPYSDVLTLSAAAFVGKYEDRHSIIGVLHQLRRNADQPKRAYLRELIHQLGDAFFPKSDYQRQRFERELISVHVLAEQLFALDEFNQQLITFYLGDEPTNVGRYMVQLEETVTQVAERTLWKAGAVADAVASDQQILWQRSVLGVTGALLRHETFSAIFLRNIGGLVQLGLIAAFALACFTELHDGCTAEDLLVFTRCDAENWREVAGPVLLIGYVAALAVAWVQYLILKANKVETKHQDYRLLAEYLRIQYLWEVLGIDRYVADDEPPTAPSESGWVASAVRALSRQKRADRDAAAPLSEGRKHWARYAFLNKQIEYHKKTLIDEREQAVERIRACGRRALVWSLIFFALLLAGVIGFPFLRMLFPSLHLTHRSLDLTTHIIIIVMVMSLAVWAALHKTIELYCWEAERLRGKLVLSNLETAHDRLMQLDGSAADDNRLRAIYIECGHFFARDQARWHALRRARPIEAPGA
ncbi:PGDYG domain-containing protein [Paraburkholderia sp. MPAMCS5]|uniref:PGDYG domain-containing protein n=1 Tax=Paraburkholderia sp. MPAMCS5 TaxID=3112563 RepID=UPI002E192C00|nr:PGDYG domain-containing protein [Paraburkholderia sp. MPAMCS5]